MEVKQVELPDIGLRDNIPHYVIGTIKIGEGIVECNGLDRAKPSADSASGGFVRQIPPWPVTSDVRSSLSEC
jgi:hypothetical protein